jgi:DNA-binding MarR family transcriptional regulator
MVDVKICTHEPDPLAFDVIERMFFGYRDFVGVADAALAEIGYGRAHHRVLHFVDRHPGLTVGELLAILKVTKQGVAKTLKTLTDDGLIRVRPGETDRREKRLETTERGHALAHELARLQTERIEAALAVAGPAARGPVCRFLAALVDEADRPAVARRLEGGL